MKNILNIRYRVLSIMAMFLMVAFSVCAADLNVIPVPVKVEMGKGEFVLSKKRDVHVVIDKRLLFHAEGYHLDINKRGVTIKAKTEQGAFYGMQTLLQILSPDALSLDEVEGRSFVLPYCHIEDYPRFGYRGFHLDPCRHFITVENVKKQIDLLARHKMNTLHFHLTDDQGWRIEIKKYPRLTTVGATRTEGDRTTHQGFYTQDEIRDIVKYAADRHITVIPELELPGHGMAAIAAYPELSCKGEQWSPRIVWGVEDIVMCPGKERMFEFLEDVVREMVPLFPSKFFHIGGDECPKTSWQHCLLCQQRIKDENLQADGQHTAEERLQSYVVKRMEKVLAGYGKRIIGWDEILEGGLSPDATVMSWRGEEGGITAALQDHDVIMTPSSDGMYLDAYQGDYKIEPVTIGNGNAYLSKTYAYNPLPDTIRDSGLEQHILGVQCNNWSEYMYSNDKMEYMMYPRALAVAEIGWSPVERKDFKDFCRRVDIACDRLDRLGFAYHIPLPEQPYGSCDHVTITKDTTVTFQNSRGLPMVYVIEEGEKTYTSPIPVSNDMTIRIATALPSGRMSRVRTVTVKRQALAPAIPVEAPKQGLRMRRAKGYYVTVEEALHTDSAWEEKVIHSMSEMRIPQEDDAATLRGQNGYAVIVEGYVMIPEDGVYYLSSTNDQLWIDGEKVFDNEGDVKRFSRRDTSLALAHGLHQVKIVFLANIIGGWPSWWNHIGRIEMRKDTQTKFSPVSDTQFFYY